MTFAEWTDLLGAKRGMAKCPAHEDRNPSLSVTEGRDGSTLLKCHAGCDTERIVAAAGRTMADLYVDVGNGRGQIIATYDYVDETGTLLYQVCRYFPKAFKQRCPDGAGGWTWNLNGVRRVLYRLPQLRTTVAAGKRVFVVEGEKDVAAVEKAGYTATCNSGGAGKWRPEYAVEFRGADIVVVTDKDAPGYAHARHVVHSLQGVAKRVVLVEPAAGKDVSDHLAAGHGLRDLIPVPLEDSAPDSPKPDRLTHIKDLLAEPDDDVSWIIGGLLPAGGMSVLAGKPKGGKSTLARAMILRVCRGEPILGRQTTQGPVIYLGLEDPRRVTKSHLRTLGARPEDDLYVFTGGRPDEALVWLEGVLSKVDPVLVVVDTLQHLLGVSDLNDYARVVASLGPVLALVRSRRAHILLVHHAGKGDRTGFDAILGSTAIVGTVDVALLLRRRDDQTRTLTTLQRTGNDLPESVVTLDAHQEPQLGPSRQDYDAQQANERVLVWLTEQPEPVTRDAVETAVEGRAELVRGALYRLVEDGKVVRTGGGRKGDPYLFQIRVRLSHHIPGHGNTNPELVPEGRNDATLSCPADPDSATTPPNTGTGICGRCGARMNRYGTDPTRGWICPRCEPAADAIMGGERVPEKGDAYELEAVA